MDHEFCRSYHMAVRHAFEEKYTPVMGAVKVSSFPISLGFQHVTVDDRKDSRSPGHIIEKDIKACCKWYAKARMMEMLLRYLEDGGSWAEILKSFVVGEAKVEGELERHESARDKGHKLYDCKYGHFDCAYVEGGSCFNELESLATQHRIEEASV